MRPKVALGLDVGERRIGVAVADSAVRIASPLVTLEVDGHELERLRQIIEEREIDTIVVGLPRNQQGDETAQSQAARTFAERLKEFG
jgi:putative holliday junction resolvase